MINFLLVFILLFLILLLVLNIYVYRGFGRGKIVPFRHGSRDSLKVALSFDDGPHPIYTPKILDILKKYDVKATFFVVSENVQKYPQIAKRIVEEGHDIGNHSFNHANFLLYKKRTLKKNIMKANVIISEITGIIPQLFRPPRGIYNKAVLDLCEGLGIKVVLWSLSSLDWRGTSVAKMKKRILDKVKGGDIILFHDGGNIFYKKKVNHENTIKALPLIIEKLFKKGFEIIPCSELLEVESE